MCQKYSFAYSKAALFEYGSKYNICILYFSLAYTVLLSLVPVSAISSGIACCLPVCRLRFCLPVLLAYCSFRFRLIMPVRHRPNSVLHHDPLVIISGQCGFVYCFCVNLMLVTPDDIHLPHLYRLVE